MSLEKDNINLANMVTKLERELDELREDKDYCVNAMRNAETREFYHLKRIERLERELNELRKDEDRLDHLLPLRSVEGKASRLRLYADRADIDEAMAGD